MLRSLYSGVSGMRSNQVKMDVIGNNIANVNTTAYKAGRARFQDLFSQTLSNAQGPSENGGGGVNPKQLGLGVSVAALDTMMAPGALQPTGRNLDFAIENEGFFIVSEDKEGKIKRFTRDGAFSTDYEGNIVSAQGLRVLGYTTTDGDPTQDVDDIKGPTDTDDLGKLGVLKIPKKFDDKGLESFSIDGTGLVEGVYGGETYYLGRMGMAKFNNAAGLEKQGGNTYAATSNSGEIEVGIANENGFGTIRQGAIEMSNVDLANEFTEMIITSRAYQANSKTISTSDEMLQQLLSIKR